MSKFCGNCGMQMDDAAFVCGNCGVAFQQPAAPVQPQIQPEPQPQAQPEYQQPQADYQAQYQYQQPQVTKKKSKIDLNAVFAAVTGKVNEIIGGIKKGDKKSIITVAGVAAAFLAIVVIVISIISVPGEEKVAKKLMKAIDNEKAESIVKLLPKFCFSETTYGVEMDEEYWEEMYASEIESFRDWVGEEVDSEKFNIKWEISDVDYFGPEYMDELTEEFEYYDDFKENKLKKVAIVEVEAVCKKGSEKYNVEIEIYAYKYGSSWYLFSWDGDSSVAN